MEITNDERDLIALADEMASAMSNLNPQTYDTFITARDRLRAKISQIVNKTIHNEERLRKMKEYIQAA